jgi:acetolactate synthase-1/3 small subunit
MLVSNQFGVLTRVTGLFSRRGFNIKELTVGETVDPAVSRITVLAEGGAEILEQIQKQLIKLEDVKKVVEITEEEAVSQELLLIKISLTADTLASAAGVLEEAGPRCSTPRRRA